MIDDVKQRFLSKDMIAGLGNSVCASEDGLLSSIIGLPDYMKLKRI